VKTWKILSIYFALLSLPVCHGGVKFSSKFVTF
jgi:hypothetical protein